MGKESKHTQIDINALSEVLVTALASDPKLLNKISGLKVAGGKPAAEKPKRMNKRERMIHVRKMFNRLHYAELMKKNRTNK